MKHEQIDRRIAELEHENAQLKAQITQLTQRSEEAERYRFLFENMEEGFCIIQFIDGPQGPLSDYVHLMANPAYCRHAGLPNVVGRTLREVIPHEADVWLGYFGGVERSGVPLYFEQELLASDRCLGLAAIRIEPAHLHQVAVIFRDVTVRKRAEQALQLLNVELESRVREAVARSKLFADVVDASAASVLVVDPAMRLLALNTTSRDKLQRCLGFEPQVGDRLPIDQLRATRACGATLEHWQRALAGEYFDETIPAGDGPDDRHYDMHFAPLRDFVGQPLGACLVAYDVTERVLQEQQLQKAEQALRQAQKMEAVGQLTGGIAHDFNNLLGGMLGALDLATDRLAAGRRLSTLPDLLHSAHDAGQRAATLVHRLLAFSRQQTLQPRPTQIRELVADMLTLITRSVGPHVELAFTCSDDAWMVRIDPPQLESSLLNLCINARDAMPEGGQIRVSAHNWTLPPEQTLAFNLVAGDYLSISVQDTGHGMPAEVLARATEPFFTTKTLGHGTGLGLSMVYGFVRQSGGHVHIQSTLGAGTSVQLLLPRYHPRPSDLPCQATAPVSTTYSISAKQIVVVEDESAMRMVISQVLADLGHDVQVYDDGPSALAGMLTRPCPDLLISDVGLPGGINGVELVNTLRSHFAGLKVLFVTGYDEKAVLRDGTPEPGTRVLTKPFTLDSLAASASQLLVS